MSFRIYCSIPTHSSGRDEIIKEVAEMANKFSEKFPYKENIEMDYLSPGEKFDPNCVKDANVVLLMHQNNQFDFERVALSKDSLHDFDLARELGKKIYLLYRTKDGKLNTYSISSNKTTSISGVPGTTDYLNIFMRNNIYDKKSETKSNIIPESYPIAPPQQTKYIKAIGIVKPMYDRRLLI